MKKFLIALLISCTAADLFAEGFQVNLQSARQTGMGHVGTAMKLGAESMHYNPAGLVHLKSAVDLSAGGSAIFGTSARRSNGTRYTTDNDVSTPLFVYAGFRIYDNFAAGLSITNPYGNALKWGDNWEGAHLIQDISLKSFAVQPTLSYKFSDKFSAGLGLMVVFGDFELSRAMLPVGSLNTLANLPQYGQMVQQLLPNYARYNDVAPVSATLEGNSEIEVGFNIGAMYDITDNLTLGVSYRSRIDMQVERGKAHMDYAGEDVKLAVESINNMMQAAGKPAVIPPLDKGTFCTKMPLPSNLNIGLSYRPTKRWEVEADAQVVFWNAYKELNIHFNEEALKIEDIKSEKKYKTACIYRLGAQYAATNRFDLRAGVYYDQTPVRSDNYNPETPSMDKIGVSAGFSFRPIKQVSIDFAYLYIHGFDRKGSIPSPHLLSPAPFTGEYRTLAHISTLGISYQF